MSKTPVLAAIHTPRLSERRLTFEQVFDTAVMEKAWTSYVRKGLRSQPVLDLYDYLDFHRSRAERFTQLTAKISAGVYEPRPSVIVRLEKKLGLCRPIVIPTPEDAIVLQCITESLLKPCLKAQPASTVFFSRSHSTQNFEFTFGKDYIWFKRWRQFSRMRFQFASAHNWIVVTDVANYFDSIVHVHLRNQLANLDGVREPILDILFRVMPYVSWSPDYLPFSSQGIPQVQFDAPRLLAHVYLYEIDKFLAAQSSGDFVRWVDDITATVDSRERGYRLVRDLDALMHMRGIRLNASKTKILSKAEAFKFFQSFENAKVDHLDDEAKRRIAQGKSVIRISKKTYTAFTSFIARPAHGQSDKVVRRYIGVFTRLKSDLALDFVLRNFVSDPSVRESAIRYFDALGPRLKIFNALESFLKSGFAVDDVSIWQTCYMFTTWEVAPSSALIRRLRRLANELSKETYLKRSPYYFLSSLWIMSKYGTPAQLSSLIRRTRDFWRTSDFFSRQVAASTSRFKDASVRDSVFGQIRGNGLLSAESAIFDQVGLREIASPLSPDLKGYITNGGNKTLYGLSRILITLCILRSPNVTDVYRNQMKANIKKVVSDPVYIAFLDAIP